MTVEEVEPWSPELVDLLRKGRPGAEPPARARDAVLAFVSANAATLGAVALAGGAATAAAKAATGAGGLRTAGLWTALKGSFGLGGIVLGVALGAAGHAALVSSAKPGSAEPEARVASAAATPHPAPSATAPDSPWQAVPAAVIAPPPVAARPDDSRGDRGKDATLASERALIDMARTAVARGQGEAA